MLGNVDAVHGLYYVLMHGWFHIFPPTEFWSRAPSGLAVGGAAAGVVVLGRQFSSRTVALASGVFCAILPRSTWAGIEARPYALSMMAAVWLTVLLVYAARRDNAWLWLSYGIALAMSILLDAYLVLLLLVHVAFIGVFRRTRTVLVRFAITSALGMCALTPFLVTVAGQAHQISWIAPIGRRTIEDVVVQQYFERSPPFALLSALVIGAAIVLWVSRSAQLAEADRQLLILAVAWLAIPTTLILVWSALVHSIYTPRYLSFTAPAMALVVGVCVTAVAVKPWTTAAIVGLLALSAVPNYVLAQRNPYAKYGMDYSQVADLITARAAPGDCLLVNDTVTFMPAPMRPLLAARPDAYRKLIDLTIWQRATDRNDVFDTNLIPEVVDRAVKPLQRRVDHHRSRQVKARLRAGLGAPARPALRADPRFRGSARPGLPAGRALAVQLGSGDQGDPITLTRRGCSRRAWPPGRYLQRDRRRQPHRPRA